MGDEKQHETKHEHHASKHHDTAHAKRDEQEKKEKHEAHTTAKQSESTPHQAPRGADPALPWKIVSSILAVLLIASILTHGFTSLTAPSGTPSLGEGVEDNAYVLGNPNAPVTIVEYSDFQCPYCARFFRQTYPQLKEEYVDTGKVKIIFKHLPLSFHKNAMNAALAAECAGEQGKFYAYHDLLFQNQGEWEGLANPRDTFIRYAQSLGLDTERFAACYDTQKYKEKIQQHMQEAQRKGISGTPSFLINGQRLVGAQPFQAFKALIDAALSGRQEAQFKPVSMPLREDDIILGNPNAPVTMIEYTDYQCPFCRLYHFQTWPTLKEYVENGTVKYVVRNFPLGFHSMANETAQALLCVAEQNRSAYWDAMDLVFEAQQELNPTGTAQYTAEDLYAWLSNLSGVNITAVRACVANGTFAQRLSQEYTEALRKAMEYGEQRIGTPFFFIGNEEQGFMLLIGARKPDAFEAVIQAYARGENPVQR